MLFNAKQFKLETPYPGGNGSIKPPGCPIPSIMECGPSVIKKLKTLR